MQAFVTRPPPCPKGPAPLGKGHKRPFLSQEVMQGPPPRSLADLKCPRLRKSTYKADSIVWEERLGGGLDGYTWKVRIHGMPFAIKVFYDTEPPDFVHYYAVQQECQNVAVLQAIEAALADHSPIQLYANPRSKYEALDNLSAFAKENIPANPSGTCPVFTPLTRMPRFRKFFGWVRLSGDVFSRLHPRLSAPPEKVDKVERRILPDQEYLALVYEFIDEGPNDKAVVEDTATFLWLTGFSHTLSPLAKNWKSSVLIDMSDIVYAGGYGWHLQEYGPKIAAELLLP